MRAAVFTEPNKPISIQEVEIEEIRIGMRIQAVWKPKEKWTHSLENIKWFAPIDEPDVDVATLRFQES